MVNRSETDTHAPVPTVGSTQTIQRERFGDHATGL
jgi:hypothetical protein